MNTTFDAILESKYQSLMHHPKNKKMTITEKSSDDVNYSIKTALYKIHAEQDKKLKSSKAYKKKEQAFKE